MNSIMGAIAMEPPTNYAAVSPPDALVTSRVHHVRGQKVMLDRDLAELYGVEVKRLKEQVRRNMDRFPEAFMFELTLEEAENSRSHFATLKQGDNIKYLPFAFTEHGILMAANVLKSKQAVAVIIRIIDLFVRMREVLNPEYAVGFVARIESAMAARVSLRRNSPSYSDERKPSEAFAAAAISGRSRNLLHIPGSTRMMH